MDQTAINTLLCSLLPASVSDSLKLALINDQTFKNQNGAFVYNYDQLINIGSSIDITGDYVLLVTYCVNCLNCLKTALQQ